MLSSPENLSCRKNDPRITALQSALRETIRSDRGSNPWLDLQMTGNEQFTMIYEGLSALGERTSLRKLLSSKRFNVTSVGYRASGRVPRVRK